MRVVPRQIHNSAAESLLCDEEGAPWYGVWPHSQPWCVCVPAQWKVQRASGGADHGKRGCTRGEIVDTEAGRVNLNES